MNRPLTVTIVLLLLISASAGAQTWSDSGLETANYKYVAVVVEDLTADPGETGQGQQGDTRLCALTSTSTSGSLRRSER
jgi:hypothetical protein